MGRPRTKPLEKSMRISLQKALFISLKNKNVKQIYAEDFFGLGNANGDGAIWRKFGQGTHVVSPTRLFDMIEKAERMGWCEFNEIFSHSAEFNAIQDMETVDEYINGWKEKIEDIALLTKFGKIEAQNQIIETLEAAIKTIKISDLN